MITEISCGSVSSSCDIHLCLDLDFHPRDVLSVCGLGCHPSDGPDPFHRGLYDVPRRDGFQSRHQASSSPGLDPGLAPLSDRPSSEVPRPGRDVSRPPPQVSHRAEILHSDDRRSHPSASGDNSYDDDGDVSYPSSPSGPCPRP